MIQEDDIFTQSGRDNIQEEAETFFALPSEVSGGEAVEAAADQGALAVAEAPVAAEEVVITNSAGNVVNSNEVVQTAGSKTFVLRDGVWIDTAYNADEQTPQQVGFASDGYFDLLSAAPEIGRYLSLGTEVLFVYGNQAYQIVEGEGQQNVTLPDVRPTDAPSTNNGSQSSSGSPTNNSNDNRGGGITCSSATLPLVAIGFVVLGRRRKVNS